MLDRAVLTIRQNPLAGDFASYKLGEYAHNGLSLWVDFGLPGILGLLGMMIWATWRVIGGRASEWRSIALRFLMLAAVALTFVKAFFYPLVPIALAAAARVRWTSEARRPSGEQESASPHEELQAA